MKINKNIELCIVSDKLKKGLSDAEIGKKYKISYSQLEQILRKNIGVNISGIKKTKTIKSYEPKDFNLETTTVWSFKSRGTWATHSGEYRGNWSPYVPRNIILKYSKAEEVILDYFCGSGTTAIEAKLLGRQFIGLDINDKAIEIAKENIQFTIPKNLLKYPIYEPELLGGDARNLSFLSSQSIDLICSHPPYADIIQYTNDKEGDLSLLDKDTFLNEMKKVAQESYRVLKNGRNCAILIGDTRKDKNIIPLGFNLIDIYLQAGFKLKELIIKRQHNCKTTGFWYKNSIKYNFLLLAHEYLAIFEKPAKHKINEQLPLFQVITDNKNSVAENFSEISLDKLETTTVWLLPENNFEQVLNTNLINRYCGTKNYKISYFDNLSDIIKEKELDLFFIKIPCSVQPDLEFLKEVIYKQIEYIKKEHYLIIQTKDIRIGNYIEPMAKNIVNLLKTSSLVLKEIIIVLKENYKDKVNKLDTNNLTIVHEYLLVYRKVL